MIHGVFKERAATLEVDATTIHIEKLSLRFIDQSPGAHIALTDVVDIELVTRRVQGLVYAAITAASGAVLLFSTGHYHHWQAQALWVLAIVAVLMLVVLRPPRELRITKAAGAEPIVFLVAHRSLADARAFVATRGRTATALPEAQAVQR